MEYLQIANWEKWQSYRKDRGQPPWIKLHRRLLRNSEWLNLTDAEQGQLVNIWMLAADKDGRIPNDPSFIKAICLMNTEPDLIKFIELGFILKNDATVTPTRRQDDAPEENRIETEEKKHTSLKNSGTSVCPHQKIIDIYHEILPSLPQVKKWPEHLQKILRTRWKEDPERQNIEWWAKFFEYIKISPFLMGKKTEFVSDLEWLIRPRNFTKIANGRYHQYIKNNISSKTERTINNLTEWMEDYEQ